MTVIPYPGHDPGVRCGQGPGSGSSRRQIATPQEKAEVFRKTFDLQSHRIQPFSRIETKFDAFDGRIDR
jgi:hypothetical protein